MVLYCRVSAMVGAQINPAAVNDGGGGAAELPSAPRDACVAPAGLQAASSSRGTAGRGLQAASSSRGTAGRVREPGIDRKWAFALQRSSVGREASRVRRH
jgi:hypothetical protein